MSKIPHRLSKKQRIDLINADLQSEIDFLKIIAEKLTNQIPDENASKLQLLATIAAAEFSSGSAPIELTYADLYALWDNHDLVPGQMYIITDYASVHFFPNTQSVVNTPAEEALFVTAIDVDQLSPIAHSMQYPQDIIYYNIESDQSKVPGCTKGYISRRIDTKQNNDIPFDFRNVKFRRWAVVASHSDTTGAVANHDPGRIVKKTSNSELYVKINAKNAVPFTDTNSWLRLPFNNGDIVSYTPSEFYIIDDAFYTSMDSNPASFSDHFMFTSLNYAQCINNTIEAPINMDLISGTNNLILGTFLNNKIQGNFHNNLIFNNFASNTIGVNCAQNIFATGFQDNIIGNLCSSNIILANASGNKIGRTFWGNIIGLGFYLNSIGNTFELNGIGSGFSTNTIGHYFANNRIGESFKNNTIHHEFSHNIINSNFRQNIGTCQQIDFSTAAEVYQDYTCWMSKSTAGTYKLLLFFDDGSLNNLDITD